jgi:hypothetical protein
MQPRKPDEIALYSRLINGSLRGVVLSSDVRWKAQHLGIPFKRACYLVDKWDRKGWYQQSSWPPGGWFTPESPRALLPVGTVGR